MDFCLLMFECMFMLDEYHVITLYSGLMFQRGWLLGAEFLVCLLKYNENEAKDNIPNIVRILPPFLDISHIIF
jgi:hypothetical protein